MTRIDPNVLTGADWPSWPGLSQLAKTAMFRLILFLEILNCPNIRKILPQILAPKMLASYKVIFLFI